MKTAYAILLLLTVAIGAVAQGNASSSGRSGTSGQGRSIRKAPALTWEDVLPIQLGATDLFEMSVYPKDIQRISNVLVNIRVTEFPVEGKLELVQQQMRDNGVRYDSSAYAYGLSLYQVKCESRSLRLLNESDYGSNDELLDSRNMTAPDSEWEAVVPGSIGVDIVSTACNAKLLRGGSRARSSQPKPNPDSGKHLDLIMKDIAAGWESFAESQLFMFKYDNNSVQWKSATTVDVMVREYANIDLSKSRTSVINLRKKMRLPTRGYLHFDISTVKISLDCAMKSIIYLIWDDFDLERRLIGSRPLPAKTLMISRNSVEENLYDLICEANSSSPNFKLPKKSLLFY